MRNRDRAARLFRIKLISLAVATCFASHLAVANPTGPVVVNGQVSIVQNGNLLQVTNSPNSIINWQSFSIGASEITRFLQQSNSSAVLNRVITQNPSAILGALQSNGRVFLINPNGILFGAGAQVDVAGLVASTLNLSDTNFLAGRLRFTEVTGAGSVINQGAINTATGGHVYLVGPAVANGGVITSPKGEVVLAAGNSVELVNPGTPNLRVEITAPDNQAINLGQIVADSGRIGIYAGLINQSGTIRADSAVVTEDGRIVLKATKGVNLEAGSVTAASGVKGGNVTVETETGTIRVAGQIDATGSEAGGAITIGVTGATGRIDLGAGLNAGNASVSLRGSGHTTTLDADIITAGADIMIEDSVVLGAPASITLDTTNNGAVASGANIKITGTTNDDATPSGLVLRAGMGGANTLAGAVGNTVPIASLTASGNTTAINGGLVNTTGNQTYNGPVTLGGPTTLTASGPTANIAINNSLFGGANNLAINSGNNVVIESNVFSGPQTVNAGGGLIVQSSAAGSALLQATGGQTINARFIDVTVQGNSSAVISNATSGNQVITVAGGGASPGIDVRSLASGGSASISNAAGTAQTITVTDADHINVNGLGPNIISNVSASIQAGFGTQTISITGSGANAINVGSAGAQDGSVINARTQSITAGTGEQSGSITIVGPAVNGSLAAILTNPGGNTQTISTSGTLSVTGGSAPTQGSNFPSGFFHNSSGPQTVTAESITLQGGLSGSLNGVNIRSAGGGDQTINALHIAITGGTGTNNFALIERTAGGSGNQTINVDSGTIALQGGSGGPNNVVRIRNDGIGTQTISGSPQITLIGGTGGEPSMGNFAQMRAVGSQVITAGETTLKAGDYGFSNSANIAAPVQTITVHGDLTLTGGGSISGPTSSADARIGGLGGTTQTPTNLMLTVDGNVTMNGGTVANAGATIGSNLDGGQPTTITMNVGGNVTLNPGTVANAGSRIGSPSANVAGGNIFVGAGGNIALNSAGPGSVSSINTLGSVVLSTLTPSRTISQGANSVIRGDFLSATANSDISLVGANQVTSGFNAATGLGGNIAFNNTSANLTVTGITLFGGGSLMLNQAGNLFIAGTVSSGPQSINATGNITVAPFGGPDASLNSSGMQTVNAGGTLAVLGGTGPGSSAQITASGGQTIIASDIVLTGGAGSGNFAEIRQAGPGAGQAITASDSITITGGSGGTNNFARIRNDGTGAQTITGSPTITITITGGTGGLADKGNSAAILAAGPQIITAGNTMLTAGASGFSNFATIGSPNQNITVHGNLTLTGGGSLPGDNASADARIGGRAGAASSPTNLMLTVDGDVTMLGGTATNAGSTIGSSFTGGKPTDITMNVGGNVTLNPGSAPDANPRIGSPAVNAAGGNIFVGAGNIALNSAGPGLGSAIRTTGNVTLLANSITQGANSSIVAGSLGVGTLNGASLGGANQVSLFSLFNSSSGDVLFNNASPLLSVAYPFSPFTAISQVSSGALMLNQAGDLAITGNVSSGPQSINVTGNMVVGSPNNSVNVSATGMQNVNVDGMLTLQGAPSSTNRFARLSATGGQAITAAGITLTGGAGGTNNSAEIRQLDPFSSQTITVTGGGVLALQGGSGGTNNGAVILGANQLITATDNVTVSGGSGGGSRIGGIGAGFGVLTEGPTNLMLNAGGKVELQGGSATGTAATIGNQGTTAPLQPTNIAINAGGSVILNAGSGSGARIGSGINAPAAGGAISISAGESIQLNSSSTQVARIRTLGNVQLHADNPGGTISETPNGLIEANALTTTSNAGTSLIGPNQVAGFNATNAVAGDIVFNNSGNLAVMASNTAPGGRITINNLVSDLATSGPVAASGGGAADVALAAGGTVNIAHPVTATGTGDVTLTGGAITVNDTSVSAGGLVAVNGASLDVKGVSSGALIRAGEGFNANVNGDLRVRSASVGGGFGGWAAILADHGAVNISAGSVKLEGGKNFGGFAAITGGPVNATTTGDFSIAGGSGLGSFGMLLSNQNIDVTVGGRLRLNSGTGFGSFARIQTLYPGSTISVHFPNLASGGYFVNGVEGRISQGLTGFFTGFQPARLGDTLIVKYSE